MLFKPSTTILTVLCVVLVTILSNVNTIQAFSPGHSPSMMKQSSSTFSSSPSMSLLANFDASSSPSNTALQAVKKGQQDGGAKKRLKKNKPIIEGPTFVGLVAAFAIFDYVYLHLIFNRL